MNDDEGSLPHDWTELAFLSRQQQKELRTARAEIARLTALVKRGREFAELVASDTNYAESTRNAAGRYLDNTENLK